MKRPKPAAKKKTLPSKPAPEADRITREMGQQIVTLAKHLVGITALRCDSRQTQLFVLEFAFLATLGSVLKPPMADADYPLFRDRVRRFINGEIAQYYAEIHQREEAKEPAPPDSKEPPVP